MINIDNMMKATAMSNFEKFYTKLQIIYGRDKVQCIKIRITNRTDYAILIKDLNAINDEWQSSDYHAYILVEKIGGGQNKFRLLRNMPSDHDKSEFAYGVVLTTELYRPSPFTNIEFYCNRDSFGDMVSDINCESEMRYTNLGICQDYRYIGEAILTVMDEIDGVKIPVSYEVYIVPGDYIDRYIEYIPNGYKKEPLHMYIARSYAFMNRPGETPLFSINDFATYMTLDTLQNTDKEHKEHAQEIMNNEGYFHDESHTLFEIVDDEYAFMIASKDNIPTGNIIINIRYIDKECRVV